MSQMHLPITDAIAEYAKIASELNDTPYNDRPIFTSPESIDKFIRPFMAQADRECGVVVALDTKHRFMSLRLSSIGSLNQTFMRPRELFRDALFDNASSLIIAHNHPSGDHKPSDDDIGVTQRIARAGDVIGLELLDHIIVSSQGFSSLARMEVF